MKIMDLTASQTIIGGTVSMMTGMEATTDGVGGNQTMMMMMTGTEETPDGVRGDRTMMTGTENILGPTKTLTKYNKDSCFTRHLISYLRFVVLGGPPNLMCLVYKNYSQADLKK